jgi:hypothetical protein
MIITQHGNKDILFKGVSAFTNERGKPLVFFGYRKQQVIKKEDAWIEANMERLNQAEVARPERKPLLRLVNA